MESFFNFFPIIDIKNPDIGMIVITSNENLTFIINNNRINELKDYIISNKLKVDDFCITGSYILELFNLRQSRDIDFLYSFEGSFDDLSNYFGSHESEIEYYHINF